MRTLRLLLAGTLVLAMALMPGHRNQCNMPNPTTCVTSAIAPSSHLIAAVNDLNFENEVASAWGDKPVLIWLVRPERAGSFTSDAKVFEQLAECWDGYVKFVRVDATRLNKGSPLDELLGYSRGSSITFSLMQCTGEEDLHHHDLYMHWPNNPPVKPRHLQSLLLDFKPNCPRSRCDDCSGKMRIGRHPLAWR